MKIFGLETGYPFPCRAGQIQLRKSSQLSSLIVWCGDQGFLWNSKEQFWGGCNSSGRNCPHKALSSFKSTCAGMVWTWGWPPSITEWLGSTNCTKLVEHTTPRLSQEQGWAKVHVLLNATLVHLYFRLRHPATNLSWQWPCSDPRIVLWNWNYTFCSGIEILRNPKWYSTS